VVDLFAGEQPTNDVDALAQALVAHLLAGPDRTRDPLVGCLSRAERGPEAAGEHLRERRDRLCRDDRVVALSGRRDDAEGQRRRGECGPEERPRVAGLALSRAPRGQVVGRHARGEAGLLGVLHVTEQGGGVDLLVRTVETDDRHGDTQPDLAADVKHGRPSVALLRGGPGRHPHGRLPRPRH
jgi:hypothetical protein